MLPVQMEIGHAVQRIAQPDCTDLGQHIQVVACNTKSCIFVVDCLVSSVVPISSSLWTKLANGEVHRRAAAT